MLWTPAQHWGILIRSAQTSLLQKSCQKQHVHVMWLALSIGLNSIVLGSLLREIYAWISGILPLYLAESNWLKRFIWLYNGLVRSSVWNVRRIIKFPARYRFRNGYSLLTMWKKYIPWSLMKKCWRVTRQEMLSLGAIRIIIIIKASSKNWLFTQQCVCRKEIHYLSHSLLVEARV